MSNDNQEDKEASPVPPAQWSPVIGRSGFAPGLVGRCLPNARFTRTGHFSENEIPREWPGPQTIIGVLVCRHRSLLQPPVGLQGNSCKIGRWKDNGIGHRGTDRSQDPHPGQTNSWWGGVIYLSSGGEKSMATARVRVRSRGRKVVDGKGRRKEGLFKWLGLERARSSGLKWNGTSDLDAHSTCAAVAHLGGANHDPCQLELLTIYATTNEYSLLIVKTAMLMGDCLKRYWKEMTGIEAE